MGQQLQGSIKQLTSELAGLKSAAESRTKEGARINDEITTLKKMSDAYVAIAKEQTERMPTRQEEFSKTHDLLSQAVVLLGQSDEIGQKANDAMNAWSQIAALNDDTVGV